MKNELLTKGIILPSGEIGKDKINLVAGAITQPFAEMVWVTTGGDMETINRLTNVLVTMNNPTDRGKLFKIIKLLYRVYEEIIKDNIAYDILLQDRSLDRDRLNEIVDLMLETVCTARKKIRIAGDDYPAELVKSKFMKLNSEHIRFVLDCMQENTTKIRNIKQYLKAVLFNAPSTIDSYYTSLVAHDMASGALAPRKPKYGDPDYYTYNEGESL